MNEDIVVVAYCLRCRKQYVMDKLGELHDCSAVKSLEASNPGPSLVEIYGRPSQKEPQN